MGADGITFTIPAGVITPGITLSVRSPGSSSLASPHRQAHHTLPAMAAGTNELAILPGTSFELPFTVALTGSDPVATTVMALTISSNMASLNQTGDGLLIFVLLVTASALGTQPVTASAPANPTSEEIPETHVGSATVLDAAAHMLGDIPAKIPAEGWLHSRNNAAVPIAFMAPDASHDSNTNILNAPVTAT